MKLAAVGDNCVDVYVQEGRARPGGNPVNVAVYTKRLGGEASYTGVVGNDEYGRLMQQSLAEKEVDISHIRVVEGNTAVTHVKIENKERVLFNYQEGVLANFVLNASDIDFLLQHDLIVTGIWGKIEGEISQLQSRGGRIAFDYANKIEHPIVKMTLPYVQYAFFSWDKEDKTELQQFMENAQNVGPKIVVATLGAKGSIAFDGEQFLECGIVPCPVVDTMGAGDSYIAGFLSGILQGDKLAACMAKGADTSAETIQYLGAW